MPPHCDTMDGPVVKAAIAALERENVDIILPWAPKAAESEIKSAFSKTIAARKLGKEAKEIADRWFFETVVRLHRAGEGEPFTGLKPAGLDEGPVLALAEEALKTGSSKNLVDFLSKAVADEVNKKLADALHKKKRENESVEAAREAVESTLGLELWSHHLYEYIRNTAEHAAKKKESAGRSH